MPTRNTALLERIVQCLGDLVLVPEEALARLEREFQNALLIVAGDVSTVATHAEELRLAIITEECGLVLDYIAEQGLAAITIDDTETAINALFPDRFIEP
jgi:hypothetical protein